MNRRSRALRVVTVLALLAMMIGAWLAAKIYHQMNTPIGVLIITDRPL